MNIKLAALGILALCAGACTPIDRGFGESSRINLAMQTVDPDPTYNEAESFSGQKGAAAVERHRTDKVKAPKGIRTTNTLPGGTSQ